MKPENNDTKHAITTIATNEENIAPNPAKIQKNPNEQTGGSTTFQEQTTKELEGLKKNLRKLEIDTKSKLNADSRNVINLIAIFVAVFTFVSVEIQILKYVCDFWKVVGLTFIIPAILILFVCSLDYLLSSWVLEISQVKKVQKRRRIKLTLIIFIFLVIGLGCIAHSRDNHLCISAEEKLNEIIKFHQIELKEIERNMKDIELRNHELYERILLENKPIEQHISK